MRLYEMFSEGDGMLSMNRMLSFLTVVLPLFVWVIISLGTFTVGAIPESVLVLIIAGLTSKVMQRYVEKKEEMPEAPNKTLPYESASEQENI